MVYKDKHSVATVLTVYGIETVRKRINDVKIMELQQYLPFTVLKQRALMHLVISLKVATVLTVYGIETI